MGERTAESVLQQTREMAAKAFDRHVVTERSEGRWLIQRIHADGRPESTYAADIVEVRRGLYVGGDIAPVVFASSLATVGQSNDIAYYMAQKATIGMGSDKLTVRWDREVAADELRQYIRELAEEDAPPKVDGDALETALSADSRHEFCAAACEALGFDDAWEAVGSMGEVVDSRVVYAHAAVQRLWALLQEEEKAAVPLACSVCGHDVPRGKAGAPCPVVRASSDAGDELRCEGVLEAAAAALGGEP